MLKKIAGHSMVKKILQLEGLFIFLFAAFIYWRLGGNLIIFIILLLVPDLSMIGYIKNKKIGAMIYNSIHNYILATAVIFIGLVLNSNLVVLLGLILTAHIGMDRLFGYGLKYKTDFKDTHMQRV